MAEKVMPHSVEAEQSVLCSMFINRNALNTGLEILTDDIFYVDAHAKIFNVMHDLHEKGTVVDLTTVTAELDNKQILDSVGGVEYLAQIADLLPTAANIGEYIRIINEKAVLRRLIDTATDIVSEGYKPTDNLNEILDEAEKKILNVVKTRQGAEFKSLQQVLSNCQAQLEKLASNNGQINGIATGFTGLDKLTNGFHPHELIILAARPGVGKTAFALNLATNIARFTDATVALFNMEMGAEQLAMRMLSAVGGIESEHLKTGELDGDWDKISEAIEKLANAKMFIDDTAGMTAGEIRSKCRRLAASEHGLGCVIIDYLTLIQGSAKYAGNRQQEVTEISRSLKTMAMELDVPVIALAQLSRNVEARDDKRPMLSDLRESGSIEQDADIVAFLYRDDYYGANGDAAKEKTKNPFARATEIAPPKPQNPEDKDVSEIELIVAKHRNGATDTIKLKFTKSKSLFEDLETQE